MLHDAGKAETGHLRSYLGQHKGILTSGTISKKTEPQLLETVDTSYGFCL